MNNFDKEINELIDKYDELDKEYISFLEADMNKEARRIKNKMYKINEEIAKLRDLQEYGLKEDMKAKIQLYKRFIKAKGLNYEFDRFVEKSLENDEEELQM